MTILKDMKTSILKKIEDTADDLLVKWRNRREKILLSKKRKLRRKSSGPDCVFTAGYYHTGTRWINELIRKNTPANRILSLRNQHRYINDDCEIAEFGKHGRFDKVILNQKNCIIVYMVRDYETWIQTFMNQPYEVEMDGDIASSTYGWPSMNIYDLYCHVVKTNVDLLRNSDCRYIIADLGRCQKDQGRALIGILEEHGIAFSRPFKPIVRHTKKSENWSSGRKTHDTSRFRKSTDAEFEDIMASVMERFEYRLR